MEGFFSALSKLTGQHLFDGFVSKILETDGLRTVVQYDIVGVRYAWLYERVNFYTSLGGTVEMTGETCSRLTMR